MTTYTKPTVRASWGQTASGSDLQDPGNTYASAGWQLGVKPPRQYFNWVLNWVFAGVRYLCQQGIATWDAQETYPVGALTLNAIDNRIYSCINANGQGQRPDGSLFSSWDIPLVATAPNNDATGRIANTGWIASHYLPVGTTVGSLPGTVTNAQVPVGAVTQWQGSLIIGGNQISGPVPRANQLYLTSGNYATFNWSGQSGQPSWLFGSNDGANVFVWNPSNFSVANANTVAGLSVTSAAAGNTVMARDANGYAYAQYLNQASGNNENPSVSQIVVTNGSDGFLRKAGAAYVASALGAFTSGNSPFSSSGYQKLLSGGIIQGGRITVSGTTNVTFPVAFPHGCLGMAFTNEGTTNQIFLNQPPQPSFFQTANGTGVINWIAFGW